ncbi:hypothetical protein KIW84_031306 [Lathyrus oleraceus]|uniref:Uncharacterized protein n=1 Tax=Pisum sativum TaxID=3888 RepID=A0A9D5B061_PEA|nr:hypothetical protein KIW84_031306 [Pisum sativum]
MPPTVPNASHVGSSSLDSHDMPPTVETIEEPHNTDIVENLRRGHRIKFPSTKLQDFVTSVISKICPSNFSTDSSRPLEEHWNTIFCVVRYLKGNLGQGALSLDELFFLGTLISLGKPTSKKLSHVHRLRQNIVSWLLPHVSSNG